MFFEQIFMFLYSLWVGSPDKILAEKIWRKKGGMVHPSKSWMTIIKTLAVLDNRNNSALSIIVKVVSLISRENYIL